MKFHLNVLAFYSLLTLLATGNLAEIPNPPVNLNVVDVGPCFVKLSWTPVPGDNIDFYKLQYRQKEDISSIFSEKRMREPSHEVRRLTPFTNYEFQVIAVNSVGDSRPTDIVEKRTSSLARGTPPKNVRAVALSPLTVLVKWDEPAKPNGIIQGYRIVYTLEPHLPITLWTTLDVPLPYANHCQATITELKPNTVYSLCVLAYSTLGEGPISKMEHVMTNTGVPSQPRNVHANEKGPNRIEVIWSPPDDYHHIQSYVLYYNYSTAKQAAHVVIQPPTNNYLLEELIPDTIYHMQVSATSLTGEGPKSTIIQMKTPQFVPGEPKGVKVDIVNSTTLFVEWKSPVSRRRNGIIRGYYVYFIQLDDNDNPKGQEKYYDTKDGSIVEAVITELDPNTFYRITVAGYTRKGDGVRSEDRKIKTSGPVPSEPRNFDVELVNAENPSVNMSWQKPLHVPGALKHFKVSWGRKGELMYAEVLTYSRYSFAINKLDKGATYEFRVQAVNENGVGHRAVKTLDIPDGVPGEPKSVKVDIVNSTTLFVEWKSPVSRRRNGTIRGYYVYFIQLDDNDNPKGQEKYYDTKDGSIVEAVITELDPNAFYRISVAGYTRKGNGERSEERIIKTSGPVPSEPRNVNVELVNAENPYVTMSWQKPLHVSGALKHFKVSWGRKGELMYAEVLSYRKYSFAIYKLDKGATYEFRVQAVNENGVGHRAVKTLDIPDGVPAGAPRNFTATGVSETAVKLEWELPVKHLQNGEIVRYQMIYRELAETNATDVNMTSTEYTIRGLDWNTDYVFQIRALTRKGAGPWSSKLIFKIEGILPAPQQVVVRRTSWKTIQVTWNEPKFPVSGYRISYNKFYVENFESWPSFDIGPYTVAEITGLEKKPYAIRVSAKSLDGKCGNASAAVMANVPTRPERYDIVTIFRVTLRTSTTINLAWEPPKQIGIKNYLLVIVGMKFQRLRGRISQQNLSPIQPINIPGQSTTFVVTNLVPKARYKLVITSLFRDGKRGPEQYLMGETRIEAPRKVQRPEIEKIEKGYIKLRLTAASEENGTISHYYLIVVPILNSTILIRPQDYQIDEFDGSPHPSVFARKPYIAAKFSSLRLPWLFTLGAGDEYEGFTNRPLNKDWRYRVFLRAHTVEQDLYTTSYYSAPITLSPYIRRLSRPIAPSPGDTDTVDQASPNVPNSKSVMIIVSVVPVCAGVALIIIGCILLIWYMRRKSHRKSKTPVQIPGKVCVDVPPHPKDPIE